MLKKLIIILCLLSVYAYGQCCFSGPISTRVGIKTGVNYCVFDPGDDLGTLDGFGIHFGLGMGTDILNFLAIDMAPQIRSTSYSRTIDILGIPLTTTYSFTNLYLPVLLSLKAGMVPFMSPYFGIGMAGNFQLNGTIRIESGGPVIGDDIDDLDNDLFFIAALGVEIKLIKFKISPEVSLNYNLTADDPDTPEQTEQNSDIHLSVGFYYAP
ncbi:hypothetical protein ES707_18376 [subsurface metagenome]